MNATDPTQRFSSRAEHYVRHRLGYPTVLVDFLKDTCNLAPDHVVADVGCGTGLLAKLFLKNGNLVYGIEPNPEMRAAAERALRGYDRFRSVDARGECTILPDRSIDFVTVGRTFHWLEPEAALSEFARILRPEGWAVIVWVARKTSSAFMAAYDGLLLTYALDRQEINHRRRRLRRFLTDRAFQSQVFDDRRAITLESLEGQTLSYSSSPGRGHPLFAPMLDSLRALFEEHQRDGHVALEHELTVHYKRRA